MSIHCPYCRKKIELPGDALRDRRLAAGLSLADVAALVGEDGVSKMYLSDVERGRRPITDRVRRAYAEACV